MPPKAYPILAPPSPVIPTEINDDHDVLCVMDMLDTLDSIPGELTQRFGDLRELDAVLNATTVHLTGRLETLTQILQKASSINVASSSSSHLRNRSIGGLESGTAGTALTEEPMKIDQVPVPVVIDSEVETTIINGDSTPTIDNVSNKEAEPITPAVIPEPSTAAPADDPIPATTAVPSTTDDATPTMDQPWDRFQILLEIAEELSRFKVGVEDKVKVAGSACDHVIQHQSHIASLLSNSTLLLPTYPGSSHPGQAHSGYAPAQDRAGAGTGQGATTGTAGGKRHRNSPMPSRYANLVNTTPAHLLPGGGSQSNSGSHGHPNGSGAGGNAGQNYHASSYGGQGTGGQPPGSETPSKKRRKTGGAAATAGAGQAGGGTKEKKVTGQPGQGDEFWADTGSGKTTATKRWDGNPRSQNAFNGEPNRAGGGDPYAGLGGYADYPAHLQATTIGGGGAGAGKQRNSPSVSGSVRGGSVLPGSTAGAESLKTGAGGSKKKSGGAGGAGKKTAAAAASAAAAAQEFKSGQGGTSTTGPGSGSAGGTGGGGRKKTSTAKTAGSTSVQSGGTGQDAYAHEYYGQRGGAGTNTTGGPGGRHAHAQAVGDAPGEMDVDGELDGDDTGDVDGEADTRLYCYCQKTSFGEMIGCDDDACAYEWFHLSCLLLDRPPEGTWLCPDCAVRAEMVAESKKKRGGGGKGGGGGGGGRKNK